MKNSKKLSKLIALTVLLGGVSYSSPTMAAYRFFGNKDYSGITGGIDLSSKTGGVQLEITGSNAATITFNSSSFSFDWSASGLPGTGGTVNSIRAISAASGDMSNAKLIISGGVINYDSLQVYGCAGTGNATESSIEIKGGNVSTVSSLTGGYTQGNDKEANNNKLYITGGTVEGISTGMNLRGGHSYYDSAEGNLVKIGSDSSINLTNAKYILGAYASTASTDNKVSVTGGTIEGIATDGMCIYGGSSEGVSEDNMTEISGGSLKNVWALYGAMAGTDVKNNKVVVDDGIIEGISTTGMSIRGGYSGKEDSAEEGSAEGNEVDIDGGVLSNVANVIGASAKKGNVNSNKVFISGGSISFWNGINQCIRGGESGDGPAEGNSVEIGSDSSINIINVGAIQGAWASSDVTNNSVSVTGGTIAGISDGMNIYGGSSYGVSKNNTTEISGGNLSNVGALYGAWAGSDATDNKISITGGSITVSGGSNSILGGESNSGNATENTVEILGGKLQGTVNVYGGKSNSGTATGNNILVGGNVDLVDATVNLYGGYGSSDAKNNTVVTNGATISGSVYGGNATSGSADNNTVVINGGTITGYVYGGYTSGTSSSNASNNIVILNGAYVIQDYMSYSGGGVVYGGYTDDYHGETSNNTIILRDGANASELYGAYNSFYGSSMSNNTLIIDGKGVHTNYLYNFDQLAFVIPTGTGSDDPLMSLNGNYWNAGSPSLVIAPDYSTQPGSIITLIRTGTGMMTLPSFGSAKFDLSDGNKMNSDTPTILMVKNGSESYSASYDVIYVGIGISKWTNVQPSSLANNVVEVTGDTTATVNGTVQEFKAGDSGRFNWNNVYGGYSSVQGAEVSDNKLTISNGNISGKVYGGYSKNGTAKDNTVTINGGTFGKSTEIHGSYSHDGTSSGNTLLLNTNITVAKVVDFQKYVFGISSKVPAGSTMMTAGEIEDGIYSVVIDPTIELKSGESVNLLSNTIVTGWDQAYIDAHPEKFIATDKGTYSVSGSNLVFTLGDVSLVLDLIPGNPTNNVVNITDSATAKVNGTQVLCDATSWRNVYGGKDDENDVSGNRVNISKNGVAVSVYGGYSGTGNVEDNGVNLNGIRISESVYGGLAAGDVKNNSVKSVDGSIGGNVYGGQSTTGHATGNAVNLSGVSVSDSVYGGLAAGDAKNNKVELGDGSIGGNVYGGYSKNGNATDNTVTINGGNFGLNTEIYGGYAPEGTSSDNTLVLSTNISVVKVADFQKYVFNLTDKVLAESVMLVVDGAITGMTGEQLSVAIDSSCVLGANDVVTLLVNDAVSDLDVSKISVPRGNTDKYKVEKSGNNLTLTVTENLLFNVVPVELAGNNVEVISPIMATINGEPTAECDADKWYNVYGGKFDAASYVDYELGVNNNTVNISENSAATNVYGGYANQVLSGNDLNLSCTVSTDYNTISLNGGTIAGNVCGGYANMYLDGFDGTGYICMHNVDTNYNKVGISAGYIGGDVYGGYGKNNTYSSYSSGSLEHNEVDISGGTIVGSVYGGYLNSTTNISAHSNTVNISAGVVGGNVYGGYVEDSGSPNSNTVNIVGGVIQGNVYGGYGKAVYSYCSSNTVNISGGVFAGSIYGAYSDGNMCSTVTISGGTFGGNTAIYGGYSDGTDGSWRNTVTISDGTFGSGVSIYGGYASNGGVASNTMIINGGTFEDGVSIYAGYAPKGTTSNNTVAISCALGNNVDVYGSDESGGTNNALIIAAKGVSAGTVDRFNSYKFDFVNVAADDIMLTAGSIGTGTVGIYKPNILAKDETITLVRTEGAIGLATGAIEIEVGNNIYSAALSTSQGEGYNDLNFTMGDTKKYVDVIPAAASGNVVEVTSSTQAKVNSEEINQTLIDNSEPEESRKTKWQNVYGGYSELSYDVVSNNQVTIDSDVINDSGSIYGGYGSCTPNNNTVIFSGGTYSGNDNYYSGIFGGYGYGTGTHDNTVRVEGGTIGTESLSTRSRVVGGYASGHGDVDNNKVIITAGSFYCGIYGAYSDYYEGESANNNSVNISDGSFIGGSIGGGCAYASANNNTVNIVGGTFGGGSIFGGGSNGSMNCVFDNNAVIIKNGSFKNAIYGGYGYGGSGKNNRVTIEGGTFAYGSIYGLSQSSYTSIFDGCNSNTVTINGGTFGTDDSMMIYGCYSYNDAENNNVIINGGSINATIYGGYSQWSITNNTVLINGGNITGKIYGGFGNGLATSNSVVVNGGIFGTTTELYGGHSNYGNDSVGNTLEIAIKGISVAKVADFQKYVFDIPSDVGSDAMLSIKGDTALTLATTDTIKVDIGAWISMPTGTYTLIDATAGFDSTDLTAVSDKKVVKGNNEYAGTFAIVAGTGTNEKLLQLTAVGELTKYVDVIPDAITGNVVSVTGGTTAKFGEVDAPAFNNGGDETITNWVNAYGGYSTAAAAVVSGNTISIGTDAKVGGIVYGGYSKNGNVTGNTVNISGGEIGGNVYGGKSDNSKATVTGNIINWSAGTIKGSEIKANNINITGTTAKYQGTTGTMTADSKVVLGDGENAATFTVGNGTAASALTIASGLDAKAKSTLSIADKSSVTLQGTSTLAGTVSGDGDLTVDTDAIVTNTGSISTDITNKGNLIIEGNDASFGIVENQGVLTFRNANLTIDKLEPGNGTLNLDSVNLSTQDEAIGDVEVDNVSGTNTLAIDIDMSNLSADTLKIATLADGTVINLTGVNVITDITGTTLNLPIEATTTSPITYVTADSGSATYKASGDTGSVTYTGNFKYTFTLGDAGKLNYKVEASDKTLGYLVTSTNDITLSLTDKFENKADAANLNLGNNMTINLNGKALTNTNDTTINVAGGKIMTVDGGDETVDGSTDANLNFTVASGSNLAIKGKTTIAGTISGAGTVTNSGTLTIEDASKIQVTGTNGLTNTGTVNLGGSTDSTLGGKITGGTLNINGNVSTDADNIQSDTNTVVSGLLTLIDTGTLAKSITGSVKNTGTLTASLDKFIDLTKFENAGTLKLSGNLTGNIVGAGTTELQNNITVTDDRSVEGTLDGNGKTIDMQEGSGTADYSTLNVGKLTDTVDLKIDVDLKANTSDKLHITGTEANNATLNLTSINVRKDQEVNPTLLPETYTDALTYTDGKTDGITFKLNGKTKAESGLIGVGTATSDNYIYNFTLGNAGKLDYTVSATDVTFKKFVEGDLGDTVTTLSLNGDMTSKGDITAITQGNTELTVNLNGHNLKSETESKVVVGTNKFNLNGGNGETYGTTDANTSFEVAATGTLAISGKTTVNGTITNAGTMTTAGTTTLNGAVTNNNSFTNFGNTTINAKLDGTGTLTNSETLNLKGSLTGKGNLDNSGTLNLLANQNLNGTITGTGTTYVDKDVVVDIGGSVAQSKISGDGAVRIGTTGTMTVAADGLQLTQAVDNAGKFNLTGNSVILYKDAMITGTGTTSIDGDVTASAAQIQQDIVVNNKLTLAENSEGKAAVTLETYAINGDGTLALSGRYTEVGTKGDVVLYGDEYSFEGTTAEKLDLTKLGLTMTNKPLVTMDKEQLLTKSGNGYVLKDNILSTKVYGESGQLVLNFGDETNEYSASNIKSLGNQLFTGDEKAILAVKGGKLVLSVLEEAVAVYGTKNGSTITMKNAQPTVIAIADKSGIKTKDILAPVGDQLDEVVKVVEYKSGTHVEDIKAQEITILNVTENSNVAAKGLEIGGNTAGAELNINVTDSVLTLVGTDNGVAFNKAGEMKVNITVDENSKFNVGDSLAGEIGDAGTINSIETSGKTNVYNTNLVVNTLTVEQGGSLNVDPSYLNVTEEMKVSGAVNVQKDGSVLNYRTDLDDLKADLAVEGVNVTLDEHNIASTGGKAVGVLALGEQVDLKGTSAQLGITDSMKTLTDNGKSFYQDGGVLVVANPEASEIKEGEASKAVIQLNAVGDISVTAGSKLIVHLDNIKHGQYYTIVAAETGTFEADTLWKQSDIYAVNKKYRMSLVSDTGSNYVLQAKYNSVVDIFADGVQGVIVTPKVFDNALQSDEVTPLGEFVEKLSDMYAGDGATSASKLAGAKALNAVTNIGEMAAVQHGALSMANQMGNTLVENMGIAHRPQQEDKYDKQVWASYVQGKDTVDGLQLGGIAAAYDLKQNGTTVGADLWSSSNSVGGVAVTYAKGDVTSKDEYSTKNDAKYYGATIYNRFNAGKNSAVLFDVGYMNASNDISQYNSGTQITADAKTNSIVAGLRYEHSVKAGNSNLVPFAGVRYMHLQTKDYENSLGMKYEAKNQNIFLPQVGLNWHAELNAGDGGLFKPMLEAGYVWTLGNRDTEQIISGETFGYDIADKGSYYAKIGAEYVKANFTFGAFYTYKKGDKIKNSKWNVNMNWKF